MQGLSEGLQTVPVLFGLVVAIGTPIAGFFATLSAVRREVNGTKASLKAGADALTRVEGHVESLVVGQNEVKVELSAIQANQQNQEGWIRNIESKHDAHISDHLGGKFE